MLKCIHQTAPVKKPVRKFATDFHGHYLFFGCSNSALLYDLYGNIRNKFKYRNAIQAGVFANNKAIIAAAKKRLYFYDIKKETNTIVKCNPISALLPGKDSDSFYIVREIGKGINVELFSLDKAKVTFELKEKRGRFCGFKRIFTCTERSLKISISHFGHQTCICIRNSKVAVFSESKLIRLLDGFPVPIYQALYRPQGSLIIIGALENVVYTFDENKNQISNKEFPFIVTDILITDNKLAVICKYGAIFMLDFEGDIVDGGFIGREIISCHISPEGFLWCLTEDSSLLVIAQTKLDDLEEKEIFSWIRIDTNGKRSHLQKVLHEINEQDKKQKDEEIKLQNKACELEKKGEDLGILEANLKQESNRLITLVNDVFAREKRVNARLKRLKKFKDAILRRDTVEFWTSRLKALERRMLEDESKFPEKEEEINKTVQEIEKIELIKSDLMMRIKQETEELSRLKEEVDNSSKEEQELKEDSKQAKERIAKLEIKIEQERKLLRKAPQQIKALEEEEKSYTSETKELKRELSLLEPKMNKARIKKENLEKRLNTRAKKLDQILLSAKIVREKEKNIPEINKTVQRLIKLIDKTHLNKDGCHV